MARVIVDEVMDAAALQARYEKCKAGDLCFISLKPVGEARVIVVHPVFGNVAVRPQFVHYPSSVQLG